MQYENGCWLLKEGYAAFSPTVAYEIYKKGANKLKLVCPTFHIEGKGDTLEGINLTIEVTVPYPEMFRIEVYHHKGTAAGTPCFPLQMHNDIPMDYSETSDSVCIYSGSMTLEICKKPFSMIFRRGKDVISRSGLRDLCYVKDGWNGYAYDHPGNAYMSQRLSLSVDELIYGMGERFGAFVKNGQTVVIENKDGGTSSNQSYKNVPFYLSNKGYGIFVNHPETVEFEVGTDQVSKCGFSVKGERLDYFFINGPTMKDVLVRYTDLTGKPSLPPQWSFGLWLSTSFTTKYDTDTVMSFVDGMLNRNISLSVFHFDCFWMKEFHWSDFVWDNRVFPDPAGLLKRIKAKGLNICVWINSYIGQESVLFNEGMEKGYFIKRTNGQVWQWDMWQPGMAIVDFTNPEAYKWFQSKLEVLLDMGVDCFKTDFGERIPSEGVAYYDGSDPKKMHNYYTYLYNKCVYELLERKRGKGQAVLFARSATVGGQKFPVHWGGDCWSDYESMEESLRGGLSLLMSGFGFWAHDIGGFENTSTADVYKRWVAFGLLSSHSRLHGSSSYRVPWVYDDEAVDVVRFFTRLKARLMPYLYKTAIETSVTGVPTMRSMVLEYTEDKTCHYVDKQYMLGDNLLVAPIFNDQSMAEYYLPKGTWTDFFTGEEKEGCGWITEKHSYLSIPLMVKENSIVAMGAHDDKPDYDYGDGAELRLYALKDGKSAEAVIYGMDQKEEIAMTAKREGNQIHITVKSDKNYAVRLVNVAAASVSAGDVKTEGKDTVISLSGSAEVTVTL